MEKKKIIARNKKANHDYFILQTLECGIALVGTEIKSIRQTKVSIQDAYCQARSGQLVIYNMHISAYDHGNIFNHKETRDRVLLAHKKEIRQFEQKTILEGLTIIPLEVYIENGLAKILVALCKGKKNYDKRDDMKRETMEKEITKMKKIRW